MFHTKFVEKIKTHILRSEIFFSKKKRDVYKLTWKYTIERDSSQMTMWRMRIACWIP